MQIFINCFILKEVATTKEDADVKAQEDSVAVHSPEQPDDSDDDFQKWSQYESAL